MLSLKKKIINYIPVITEVSFKDEYSVIVYCMDLILVLFFFKSHVGAQYKILSCISGVDFLGKKYRFCVVYDLLSLRFNTRVRVKTFINEITSLESSILVYKNANWWEREIWDMFGIYFEKHCDLRRILTDYGFEGYPLRKDFPLSGYTEVRFSEGYKRVVIGPVGLTQEYRFFNYENPWQ